MSRSSGLANLPFSLRWGVGSKKAAAIYLYLECDRSWQEAGRMTERGWPCLLLPHDLKVSDAHFPVCEYDVYIIDRYGVGQTRAMEIGTAVIEAGANAAVYLRHGNDALFFVPEAKSWVRNYRGTRMARTKDH